MLPYNSLSVGGPPGTIIQGKALTSNLLVDYETGGIGLNDSSQGMLVQIWKGEVRNSREVFVSAPNTPPTFVLSAGYALTEISIAFDQNMHPCIAFMENGLSKLYWYDTTIPGPTYITLPAGARNPKITLDDKRPLESGNSDIILAYMNGTSLYFRMQRERFTVERLLATGIDGDLLKIGMNDKLRLQFELGKKMSEEELLKNLAKGSPISSFTVEINDAVTTPSDSDIWELERKS